MDIKSNLQLLSEAAEFDLRETDDSIITIDTVREAYDLIPEADEPIVTESTDVIITNTRDGEYYVEMVNLAPFMFDSGITNIAEALDIVAEANNLPKKSVGLIIESQDAVDAYLEAAKKKSEKTKDPKHAKKAAEKINKSNAAAAKLLKNGYKVKKKSVNSKVCPSCGKVAEKCMCELAVIEAAKARQEARKKPKPVKKATGPSAKGAVPSKGKCKICGKDPCKCSGKGVAKTRECSSPSGLNVK